MVNKLFPLIRSVPTKYGTIDRFVLAESITIELIEGKIRIPKGTITDIASIPKPALAILTRTGQDLVAFIVHDYLYANHSQYNISRLDIDNIMRKLMIKCLKINKNGNIYQDIRMNIRIFLIYWSVRLFGYPFYARWIKLD